MRTHDEMIRWLKAEAFTDPFMLVAAASGVRFTGRVETIAVAVAKNWACVKCPRAGECFANARAFCLEEDVD